MAVEGTVGVILLNAPPRGCIITANGQAYGGTVGKHRLALYESFAERTASDNQSAIVILKRTCENLRRRSGELVEEYNKLSILEIAVPISMNFLA